MSRGRKGKNPSTSTSNKRRAGGRRSGFWMVRRSVTTSEGGDFAAVAADGHGTPAAPVRAGGIVEKKAASRIGAQAQPRLRAFGDDVGRGTGHRGKQPLEAALPGDEFNFPVAVARDKFFMPFGDAQDFVHRLDPFPEYPLPAEESIEGHAQRGTKPPGLA